MKLAVVMISFALATGTAFAADDTKADKPKKEPSAAQKAQQTRMKDCNAQATGKTGDDRKAFMKQCLSGAHAMASGCEAQATGKKLTGTEKVSFIKKCRGEQVAVK